jgi:hypothetical protein
MKKRNKGKGEKTSTPCIENAEREQMENTGKKYYRRGVSCGGALSRVCVTSTSHRQHSD